MKKFKVRLSRSGRDISPVTEIVVMAENEYMAKQKAEQSHPGEIAFSVIEAK